LAELGAAVFNSKQLEMRSLLLQVLAGSLGRSQALQIAHSAVAASLDGGEVNDLADAKRTVGLLILPELGTPLDASAEADAER